MEKIIEIKGLIKKYGDFVAVKGIDLSVEKGQFFAFLGENGAGKSTTISVMCGTLKKDGGSVTVAGCDTDTEIDKVKSKIGVVFQNGVLDKPLTVKDNLESRASLYGITGEEFNKKLKYLTELFGLQDILNRPVGKLSGGQKRKVDIARAVIHDPEILILDEPTTGLDPQTRKTVWDIIHKFRKEKGMTVFLTTHYMEETADADYIVIIDEGKVVAEGSPLTLKNRYATDSIILYGVSEDQVKGFNLPYEKIADAYKLQIKSTETATELIVKNPDIFRDYEILKGKMDDVFLSVTGKNLSTGDNK